MYPSQTPVPRTTGAAALQALVVRREIHERFERGLAAENRGDWQTALANFTRILALHPDEPQGSTAAYDAALAQANLGALDDAVASLTFALTRDPQFVAAASNLVSVELLRNDLTAARSAAERLLAIAPRSARAQYLQGLVALRQHDAAAARAAFTTLLDLNPSYAVAHYTLALAELQDGQRDEARRELQRALALAPDYAVARLALGTLLLQDGSVADAAREFDRAAHDARDPALRNLATALHDQAAKPQ